MRRTAPRLIAAVALATITSAVASSPSLAAEQGKKASAAPLTIVVFDSAAVHFLPADPARYATAEVRCEEDGRVLVTEATLPAFHSLPHQIIAHVTLMPIPMDEQSVCDPWDRAGNIRLSREGHPDLEVVKFVTAYGGETTFDVDVSQLAPLLSGRCRFKAFVDTWLSPAWHFSFALEYRPAPGPLTLPAWVMPVAYAQALTRDVNDSGGIQASVEIPSGLGRVLLYYLVSGHCTDGRDADEFQTKDNVLRVDDRVVYRYRPWRDDCRSFRDLNPYCRRWSDGSWSCDYDRSGWCPGDVVAPLVLDLSDPLTPGPHRLRFEIEDIRPRDENGAHGYWRLSAYLVGYR
jgi:hypothetical protein